VSPDSAYAGCRGQHKRCFIPWRVGSGRQLPLAPIPAPESVHPHPPRQGRSGCQRARSRLLAAPFACQQHASPAGRLSGATWHCRQACAPHGVKLTQAAAGRHPRGLASAAARTCGCECPAAVERPCSVPICSGSSVSPRLRMRSSSAASRAAQLCVSRSQLHSRPTKAGPAGCAAKLRCPSSGVKPAAQQSGGKLPHQVSIPAVT